MPTADVRPSAALVVRVVIVTAFPPELVGWTSSVPLNESLPFPAGAEPGRAPLRLSGVIPAARSFGRPGQGSGYGYGSG